MKSPSQWTTSIYMQPAKRKTFWLAALAVFIVIFNLGYVFHDLLFGGWFHQHQPFAREALQRLVPALLQGRRHQPVGGVDLLVTPLGQLRLVSLEVCCLGLFLLELGAQVVFHALDHLELVDLVKQELMENPVLDFPAGRDRHGLPIGLQIAAPQHAERPLIHFGKMIEQLGFAFSPPELA